MVTSTIFRARITLCPTFRVADPLKLTFIILRKEVFEKDPTSEVNAMVGDVNLFFQVDEDCEDSEDLMAGVGEIAIEPKCPKEVGLEEVKLSAHPEINIMIADKKVERCASSSFSSLPRQQALCSLLLIIFRDGGDLGNLGKKV